MRSESVNLEGMIEVCETIAEYVSGHTLESFEKSAMVRDAVHYQLMVIGEATRYLSDQTKAYMPQIPWPAVRRTRNVLIHDCLKIDETIIRETVVRDLPALAQAVRNYLPPQP